MKKAKTKKLSVRITLYCVIFACVLSIVIGGLGFYSYYTNSIRHYENYINTILQIAGNVIDGDDMIKNIQNQQVSKKYNSVQLLFNNIKDNSTIEYIYIIAPDKSGIYSYVLCGYNKEELERGRDLRKLGDLVNEDIDPNMLREFTKVMEGKSIGEFIPNTSDLGYVMTGGIPIKDSKGNTAAVLGVDILMDDIIKDLQNYVLSVLIGTILLVSIFLIFFIQVIKRRIVKPIVALGKHTSDFVGQTQTKPSEMKVTELVIKTGDEIELLTDQFNNMMKDIVTYMTDLESVTAVQERFSVQLDLARQIQQSLLPCIFPAFPERTEFDIYALMQPAKAVGGDFYDFFMVDGTHLGVVVADVSDEGVPAALFMMITKTLIKNFAVLGLEPAKVFIEANNELCEYNDAEMTVTAFMGILDVYSGDFIYTSAGEHRPLIRKKGEQFESMPIVQGFLLGSLEKIPFKQYHAKLEEDDMLCLFTKGISNIENEKGEKFDLKESLNQSVDEGQTLKQLLEDVKAEAERFTNRLERKEDIAMVMIRFEGIDRK